MNQVIAFGLFGAVALWLCRCSNQAATPNKPKQPSIAVDYSLTQRSASQPERGRCNGRGCSDETVALSVPGRCDVELCEADLSATAVAELRAAAVRASDCYERELKDRNQLEGKMLVRLRLASGREPCEIRIQQSTVAGSEAFTRCVIERLRETHARPSSGCIDLDLPLSFVRQEVDAMPADQGINGTAGAASNPNRAAP